MFVTYKSRKCLQFWFLFVAVSGVNSSQRCGRLPSESNSFVNGEPVGSYMYPWFAIIQTEEWTNCAGTLIANNLVVSAAHCFADRDVAYKVKLGVNDICHNEEQQRIFDVWHYYVHEEYEYKDPLYDIALVILLGDTSDFEPICLPDRLLKERRRGAQALIIGIGTIYGTRTNVYDEVNHEEGCQLRSGTIELYPDDVCNEELESAGLQPYEEQTKTLCAGILDDGVDTCQGDTGGPLVATDRDNRYFLLGVLAFGNGCDQPGTLGVYTDITHFIDWIKDLIEDSSVEYPIFKKFVAEIMH